MKKTFLKTLGALLAIVAMCHLYHVLTMMSLE